MLNNINTIQNSCFKKEKLGVLCTVIHERYESNLAKTGHNFYAIRSPQVKDWKKDFSEIPSNYILLNPERKENQLPLHLDIDVVISGNKFGAFGLLAQYANKFSLPLISVEHTAPHPNWPIKQLEMLKQMRGDTNIFISEWSRRAWGWDEGEAEVIHHGIDTDLFRPKGEVEKKPYILTTVNEFSQNSRTWCCGYPLYQEVTKDLPKLNVGNDPPHSKPAKDINELVYFHNEAYCYLNTAEYSPFPMSLFEAMSVGNVVISTPTCMIPDVIVHEENGLLPKNKKEMRFFLEDVLKNRPKYEYLGVNARKTILERFPLEKFLSSWQEVFARYQ